MNKYALIIIVFLWGYNQSNGQQKKYLLGTNLQGNVKVDNNDFTENSNTKQSGFNFGGTLYGGRFITANIFVFTSFLIETGKSETRYVYPVSTTNPSFSEHRYGSKGTTFKPGIGIRKYWAFSEKNVVGLFLDLKTNVGFTKRKNSQTSVYKGETAHQEQTDKNYNSLSELIPGTYINLNKNWQMLLSMGGVYYSHTWWKKHEEPDNNNPNNVNIIYPEKAKSFGLSFNAQSFVFSIARRL